MSEIQKENWDQILKICKTYKAYTLNNIVLMFWEESFWPYYLKFRYINIDFCNTNMTIKFSTWNFEWHLYRSVQLNGGNQSTQWILKELLEYGIKSEHLVMPASSYKNRYISTRTVKVSRKLGVGLFLSKVFTILVPFKAFQFTSRPKSKE